MRGSCSRVCCVLVGQLLRWSVILPCRFFVWDSYLSLRGTTAGGWHVVCPFSCLCFQLYVDFKSESLLVPIHGSHLPFHLSTVKNVTCSEAQEGDNSGSSSSSSSSGKSRAQFFVLRVNFQVPGSQTLTLKGEENPLPDLSGKPETVFVKELMFRSEDGRHLQSEEGAHS